MDGLERDAGEIRARVQTLVAESSQAELARRVGTSKNNVSRYLRGAKIPIEFGAALVRGAGVNPSWLLTGEGASSLADVSEEASETAGELLDLVHAMSAISKMKLGALAGRERAKTLRELNDALDTYEDARVGLVAKTRPIFTEMIGALEKALEQRNLRLCEELKAGLEQVVRLCPDEDLEQRMLDLFSVLEFQLFNFDAALKLQRELFYRMIKKGRELDNADLLSAHNFARMLKQCCYSTEARGVCRAALSLASPSARSQKGFNVTSLLLGWLDVEHGSLSSGIKRVTRSFPQLSDEDQDLFRGVYTRPLLLAGAIDAQGVWGRYKMSSGMLANVLNFACCEENYDVVEHAYVAGNQREGGERMKSVLFTLRAKFLLEMRKAQASQCKDGDIDKMENQMAAAAEESGLRHEVAKANARVIATQLALVAGKNRVALDWLVRSERCLRDIPEGMSLSLLMQTTHHRNLLKLVAPDEKNRELCEMRERSLDFAKRYKKRGYGFIAKVLQDCEG